MADTELTRFERLFREWMRISWWLYVVGFLFFLVFGAHIPSMINAVSRHLLPLPLYPLPATGPEGAFWRVLGVSMMAMLVWICGAIHADVRGNLRLTKVLLLSKGCSTLVYSVMFLGHHELAYLVGALTDGPIFLITWALWFEALPADRLLSPREENILAAIGDAMMPQGGAFPVGYLDLRDASLEDARAMLASQDASITTAARLVLRLLNWAPYCIGFRFRTLEHMDLSERAAFLVRIENNWIPYAHLLIKMTKMYVLLPFFKQEEAAAAVGYQAGSRLVP